MLLNRDTPPALGSKHVRAVIFDWAGTTVDFGSLAPVRTLERVFSDAGVPITEEARRDMFIARRGHIQALLGISRIREEWSKTHGRAVTASDVDSLYERFIPLQFECLKEHSGVISGVPAVVDTLRSRGIKIGSTTGYIRAMLDVLVAEPRAKAICRICSLFAGGCRVGTPLSFHDLCGRGEDAGVSVGSYR